MEGKKSELRAALSDLEDQYAQLLTEEASDKELNVLWSRIRSVRQQLHELERGAGDHSLPPRAFSP